MPDDGTHPTGDEELAHAVACHDLAAFATLYDRYAPAVYALAYHTLGRAEAEEVVQDVFTRLWERAHQFDPNRSHFSAWLMAIARHRVLDELRRHNQQRAVSLADNYRAGVDVGRGPGGRGCPGELAAGAQLGSAARSARRFRRSNAGRWCWPTSAA